MSYYIKTLFYAIPTFAFLILIEAIVAKIKGLKINRPADVISSLSSGITNTIRDAIKFTFAIVTYSWLVDNLAIYKLDSYWLVLFIAFLVQDFSGYWVHRLNHRVNILWNRHFIHHSSEDFNLSCALRQSISNTIKFSAIFMIPGALLGVPASIFAVLGPIHLFMQLWYHTQLIGNLGLLEYVFVTPSHHRVHHAINDEYIDKNYGQILIVWDKIFGTFQAELKSVPPVYGTLNQANTWNPILINYKYFLQLLKDAWRTKNLIDKIKIWFMPTGWRPNDVSLTLPRVKVDNVYSQKKYKPRYNLTHKVIAGFHFFFLTFIVFTFLSTFSNISNIDRVVFMIFIFTTIFSFSSLMDGFKWSINFEFIRILTGSLVIVFQENIYLSYNNSLTYCFIAYFIISLVLNFIVLNSVPKRL